MAAPIGSLFIDMRASVARFAADMNKSARRLRRFGGQVSRLGRSLTTGITLPLAVLGGSAFKMSTDFASSLTKMQSLVGVSQKQINAWRDDILKLAAETGRAPLELADAMFFITSAGQRGAAALDTLKVSAMASAAGLGATEAIADAVTSAINKYGAENLSAAKATGILVAAVREGKASAASLAPVLGQLLPLAQDLGVGFDQVAAAIAATSRGGLDAAKSATALKGILKALKKPAEGAEKTLTAFGTSSAELRKQIREQGLLTALTTLKEKFGDNQDAMAKVFPDIEGLVGILSLLGGGAEETRKIFAVLAAETGGSLTEAFTIAKKKDPQLKLAQSTAKLAGAMIKLGDVLTPVIIPALTILAELVVQASEWFGALGPDVQQAGIMIAAAFAVGGPVMVAIGFFTTALTAIAAVAGKALAAIGFFAKAIGALIAVLGGPVVAAIGLFIAAAGLAFAAYKNWDKIGPIVKRVFIAVKEWLVDKFKAIVRAIGESVEAVTGFFRDMWQKVAGDSYVPDMIKVITREFGRLDQVMVNPARRATREVSGVFSDMGRAVSSSIQNSLGALVRSKLPGGFAGQILGGLATSAIKGIGSLFGFSHGGAFTVPGGVGGPDNKLVAFRAKPGENVQVTPAGARRASGASTFIFNVDARGADAGVEARVLSALKQVSDSIEGRALNAVAFDRDHGGATAQPLGG